MHAPKQPEHASVARLRETPLHTELRDAMHETLGRLREHGIPAYLTGGVAASILSETEWPDDRPLSRDLDFLVMHTEQSMQALEEIYGGSFGINHHKPVFQSLKLQTVSAGNGVDLDFIAQSNITLPDGKLSMRVTPTIAAHAKKGEFLGQEVDLLPPAAVVLQKLFAGRGREIDKFDLTDAEAILRTGTVDPNVFRTLFLEATSMTDPRERVRNTIRLRRSLSRLEDQRLAAPYLAALDSSTMFLTIASHCHDFRTDFSSLRIA